jgi:Lrp/AsnC family transcriptional regulator, leucine-responsive regulatory protein
LLANLPLLGVLVESSAIDSVDRAILKQLQAEGRLSNLELADRVGLSPSPCLRRVRRLEVSGVIAGYRAVIDPTAVDRGFQVLVHVTMEVRDRAATMEAFEARVAELDEVIECRRMFGDPDYLLWVAAADLAAYEELYMTKLVGLPGVARTVSQLTMKTVKPGGQLPL